MSKYRKVERFLDNLTQDALRSLAYQLILYPEQKEFIHNCIEEFSKFYETKEEGGKQWQTKKKNNGQK